MKAGTSRSSPRPESDPGANACRIVLAATLLGTACATRAEPARLAAEAVAVTLPRDPDAIGFASDVSAVRTRFVPTAAPVVTPDGRILDEVAGVQARLWRSRGRTAWGVGIGTIGYVLPPAGPRPDGPVTLAGASPALSFGMRYRLGRDSVFLADALGVRALPPDSSGYIGTKVGMEWKPARSRFGFDGSTLGIHLDSGYRLSVRARRDGLGVYLRGQF